MAWLYAHADLVTAAATVGLLAVWIAYANLFYQDYKRERMPLILIDQMSGPGTEATCTLANVSARAVYLECVLAVATLADRKLTAPVTDHEVESFDEPERRIVARMRQGPLASGQLISVGSIRELAQHALRTDRDGAPGLDSVESLEIRVAVTMGTEDEPIGATKRFDVDFTQSGHGTARPARLGTRQLRSRRARRAVRSWITDAYGS